jgi:hypothetical protein
MQTQILTHERERERERERKTYADGESDVGSLVGEDVERHRQEEREGVREVAHRLHVCSAIGETQEDEVN